MPIDDFLSFQEVQCQGELESVFGGQVMHQSPGNTRAKKLDVTSKLGRLHLFKNLEIYGSLQSG